MLLGQPTTPAEIAAEQAHLAELSARRERRNAQIVREVLADLRGVGPSYRYRTLREASLAAARRHKLGRGGAQYVRDLVERAP